MARRRWPGLPAARAAAVTAVVLAASLLALLAPSSSADTDPLQRRVLGELEGFIAWLEQHDAEGYIGEVGWPAGEGYDTERWNALADRWLARAREAGLWVTVWGAGAWWGPDYPLSPFVASEGVVIDTAAPQAEVLARHTGPPPLGVNVSGGEFGAPGGTETRSRFSAANPGEPGVDYIYDGPESFAYLAAQGMDLVRLPLRWERVQPALFGPLDGAELARLRAAVGAAGSAGMRVVLDVHNYGGYFLPAEGGGVRRAVGSPQVPAAALADLWARLSAAFEDDPAIAAYGLMNEPHTLAPDEEASARRWERASQAAVDAIRARGDDTLVMVPGASWSNVRGWAETHPQPWIDDPAGNVRYEAHHYFDADHSGSYEDYGTEVERARD